MTGGAAGPLMLSLLAGLSTGIGGVLSVVRMPGARALAALLGLAAGVMGYLAVVEMWIDNALEHAAPVRTTLMFLVGAAAFLALEPLLPEPAVGAAVAGGTGQRNGTRTRAHADGGKQRQRLLRLGVLMAVTMTLHNLPEGFAVGVAALTDSGPLIAMGIGLHNIPEGVVIAAPIYAATGSRLRAVGAALASGLSEPLGAAAALALVRASGASVDEAALHALLAAVGGLMFAVCAVELLPEARQCGAPAHMWGGIAAGVLLIAAVSHYCEGH